MSGIRPEVQQSIDNAAHRLKEAVDQIEAESGKNMAILKVQAQHQRQQLREERKAQHIAIEHHKHEQLNHVYAEFAQWVHSITQLNSHPSPPNSSASNITYSLSSVTSVVPDVSTNSKSIDRGQCNILRMPTNVPALTIKNDAAADVVEPSAQPVIKAEK